jgi:putative transposase
LFQALRERGLSKRQCARLVRVRRGRTKEPRDSKNETLRQTIIHLSNRFPRFGYRRIHAILVNKEGWRINVKRVRRIRVEEGLQVKKKTKKRKRGQGVKPPEQATAPNRVWTVDFVQDRLTSGSSFRLLTVLDEFTRESLSIRVERSLRAEDVRLTLQTLFKDYGVPMYLRSDNGAEFVAHCLQSWLKEQHTQSLFIEPGSPWQNGKCESFNGRFRDECLNMEWFDSLKEAQVVIEAWRVHYNTERPHSALQYRTPEVFILDWQREQAALRLIA